MCQGLVFTTDCGELPNPEYTGAFDILYGLMVENDSRFVLNVMYVKCIRHDQEDVNIVGMGRGRDEGTEYDEPCNLRSADGQRVDAFRAVR